ncbi:MAG: hypothetical protein EXR67_05325, partial [Dehalococcoidia bacterium]|nr:hypothetical protein [Dehalococcoidia bacterium]
MQTERTNNPSRPRKRKRRWYTGRGKIFRGTGKPLNAPGDQMDVVSQLARDIYHFISIGATTPWGLVILFFLVGIGEMGVPTPLIIESTFMAVGIRLGHGMLIGFLLLATTVLGSLLGASIVYYLGRRGSGLLYHATWFRKRVEPERVAAAMRRLSQTSPLTLAFVRFIPGLLFPASLAAGAARMKFRSFVLGVLISDMVWNGSMLGLGVILGRVFPRTKSAHAFWFGVLIAVSAVGVV